VARVACRRAARRAVALAVVVAIALGAVWTVPRVSGAAARWVVTPPVRERTLTLDGGLPVVGQTNAAGRGATTGGPPATRAPRSASRVVEPGFSFDMVGLLCDEPSAAGRRVTVDLRASEDGTSWSEWYHLDLERAGATEAAADAAAEAPAAFTEPVWVDEARFVEVRAAAPSDFRLRGVRLMFLNTSGDGTPLDTAVSALRSAVATVAGLGPSSVGAMTATPKIVRRAEWGADESWRSGAPAFAPVEMAFVHHTVNANSYTRAQAPGLVRGIYYYDTKGLKWSDLGYNFLIDRYGTIYEGRYGGVTKGVVGAQVLGFNTGSTGVAMIGTFGTADPPSAMMGALKKLLAWKLDVHHVDPQGRARMVCRATQKFRDGEAVVFPVIAGHRQANYTACPGDALYRRLAGVRTAVAAMGLPKIYEYEVGTAALSPNADGVGDSTRVRFRISAPADWRVEVIDEAGVAVRTVPGNGREVDVRWDCRDDDGALVPDGAYRIVGRAGVSGVDARAATATVRVDTVAPIATDVRVVPGVFSPNGDGYADSCRLRFTTAEACAARARVVDAGGDVLRDIVGWRSVAAGSRAIPWDGRISSSGALLPVPEGRVLLRLELRDAAGNRSSQVTTVVVDRTLGFLTCAPATLSPNGDGIKDTTSIGFTLTRRAAVAIEVRCDGAPVRTLASVTYGAGERSVVWDGLLGDGTRATSATYSVRATAASALGEVAASRPVIVDRYRPRLRAPARVTPLLGNSVRVAFNVHDPYSPKVRVTARVRSSAGKVLAVIDRGWIPVDTPAVVRWKPPARRTYMLTLTAVDRGGNQQSAAAVTEIVVR